MKYLIILNRFDFDKGILKNKLTRLGRDVKISEDDKRLILDCSYISLDELIKVQEINKIYLMYSDWKELNFKNLVEDCLKAFEQQNKKDFLVQARFLSKIPISAKSIYKKVNAEFKKHNYEYKEDAECTVYVEIKKDKKVFYRIFTSIVKMKNKNFTINFNMEKFIVVLENPGSVIEISDFLRICWIFKIPLYFLNVGSKFNFLLEKAKKMTKGIPYEQFKINIVKEIPKDYVKVGFSKNASDNENVLKDLLNKKIVEKQKMALVFGDEKFGLTQKTRDMMDYSIRISPDLKKPLRASHALSYVLGFYVRTLN
ncbi:MAG: hypothetical protein V1663_00950 [archaeon]